MDRELSPKERVLFAGLQLVLGMIGLVAGVVTVVTVVGFMVAMLFYLFAGMIFSTVVATMIWEGTVQVAVANIPHDALRSCLIAGSVWTLASILVPSVVQLVIIRSIQPSALVPEAVPADAAQAVRMIARVIGALALELFLPPSLHVLLLWFVPLVAGVSIAMTTAP